MVGAAVVVVGVAEAAVEDLADLAVGTRVAVAHREAGKLFRFI